MRPDRYTTTSSRIYQIQKLRILYTFAQTNYSDLLFIPLSLFSRFIMSTKQGFASNFDLHAAQFPIIKVKIPSPSSPDAGAACSEVQQNFEEARQERAYDLYKQDIADFIQSDPRSRSVLWIMQELSVDLFSGKRILRPSPTFS